MLASSVVWAYTGENCVPASCGASVSWEEPEDMLRPYSLLGKNTTLNEPLLTFDVAQKLSGEKVVVFFALGVLD